MNERILLKLAFRVVEIYFRTSISLYGNFLIFALFLFHLNQKGNTDERNVAVCCFGLYSVSYGVEFSLSVVNNVTEHAILLALVVNIDITACSPEMFSTECSQVAPVGHSNPTAQQCVTGSEQAVTGQTI